MCYVYVLQSQKDQRRYIGLTDDISRRLKEHNNGEVSATKGRRPFILIYSERFDTRAQAAFREQHFKSGQGREELNKIMASLR
jgi:putative endonuclease